MAWKVLLSPLATLSQLSIQQGLETRRAPRADGKRQHSPSYQRHSFDHNFHNVG